MRLHRFFIKEPIGKKEKVVIEDVDILHQWKKVFRLTSGDKVVVFDGQGSEYVCVVDMLSKERAELSVESEREVFGVSKEVWLCVGIIKKDNFEWIVEKGTELGVSHFVPIVAERSEKKDVHMERLEKIACEASEQSGRGTTPTIHSVKTLEEVFSMDLPARKILLHPEGEKISKESFSDESPVALFIGPEGGWSDMELKFFKEKNVVPHTLGQQILRAETASVAVSALFLL